MAGEDKVKDWGVLTQVNNSLRSKQTLLTFQALRRPCSAENGSLRQNSIFHSGNGKLGLISAMLHQLQVTWWFKPAAEQRAGVQCGVTSHLVFLHAYHPCVCLRMHTCINITWEIALECAPATWDNNIKIKPLRSIIAKVYFETEFSKNALPKKINNHEFPVRNYRFQEMCWI